jgi:hypothetical protein
MSPVCGRLNGQSPIQQDKTLHDTEIIYVPRGEVMNHLQQLRISLFNVSDALHRENLDTLLIDFLHDRG